MSMSHQHGKHNRFDLATQAGNADTLGLWSPMVSGVQAWHGLYGKAAAAMGLEWINFVNRRMGEEMALSGRLAGC